MKYRFHRNSFIFFFSIILPILFLLCSAAFAKDGGGRFAKGGWEDGKEWRRIGLFVAAHLIYSGLDALLYPKVGGNNLYRIGQNVFFVGQVYTLYRLDGLSTAAGYTFSHWSFNNDHLYYLWYELFYGGGINAWNREILGNNCTWARWTWMGLGESYFTGRWDEPVSGITLIIGGAIGIGVGISLTIFQPL